MDECNKAIIEKLCMTVCTDGDGGPLNITRDEALRLLNSLLGKQRLAEQVKRVEVARRPPRVVHHLRFRQYFEVFGHNGMIDRLCFDNSSNYAFSGSVDGIIKIWDVRHGMLVRSLYGHCSSINDLCVSIAGEYLVSADYQGMVCVWCLRTFALLHSLDMQSEVIFCEFFAESGRDRGAPKGRESAGTFACILANGVVKTVKFCRASVVSVKENVFMQGESIKAICITDGGRFVVCGGWWPFILIYDTHNLESVMVLEDFKAQTLCACRNGLKIAASATNKVCIYTFYVEGGVRFGNFKKRRNVPGCWRKVSHTIESDETVERMCFLSSFLLVTASTDGFLRVYDDEQLVLSEPGETGCLYAHPFRNIFAVVGQRLSMYEIIENPCDGPLQPSYLRSACFNGCCTDSRSPDHICIGNQHCVDSSRTDADSERPFLSKFFSEPLLISINDCQFSNDGRFFITSDDRGTIRAYSIGQPISVPEQQFFVSDFNTGTGVAVDGGSRDAAHFDYTVDAEKNRNRRWKKYGYSVSRGVLPPSVQIEALVAKYLEKERMDFAKFSARYLVREEAEEVEEGSSDDKTWTGTEDSRSSSEGSSLSTEDTQSRRGVSSSVEVCSSDREERMVSLRRNRRVLVSDSEDDSRRVSLRRDRRMSVSDSESDRVPLRRRMVRDGASDSQDGVIRLRKGIRIPRRVVEETESSEGLSRSTASGQSTGSLAEGDTGDSEEDGSRSCHRPAQAPGGGPVVHRRQLRRDRRRLVDSEDSQGQAADLSIDPHLETALSSYSKNWLQTFLVYADDRVFFDSEAYRAFIGLEGRLGGLAIPETGVHSVVCSEILFIGTIPYLSLRFADCAPVCFYEYPEGKGIMCHEAQREASGTVDLVAGDRTVSSLVLQADGLMIRTSAGWHLRAFIAVRGPELGLPPIPYSHTHRVLFGRVRGGAGRILDIINYDTANRRIALGLYRSAEQLLSDLKTISQAAAILGHPHSEYARLVYEGYK